MTYITAKTQDGYLYIDKEQVKAVVALPDIRKVPHTDDSVLGVSVYDEKLVVYYPTGSRMPPLCGIILKDGRALAADEAGEEDADTQDLVSVMPGVWEKKID
jgi:hypothetical protein